MPYPPFAEIETNYTAFQQGQGDNSFPGQQVDTDLANLVEAVDTLNQFVRGFSRSDGEIGNQTIGHDQLKSELSIGLEPPTTWVTATDYEAGDTVFEGLAYYRATADHTSSGSFATDLGAGLWEELIDFEESLAGGLEGLVEAIVDDLVPEITADVIAAVPAVVSPMIAAAAQIFPSVADVEAFTAPGSLGAIRTNGYTTAGDDGAALYVRVGSEPAHDGKIQSDDGAWWEIAETVILPEMLGAIGNAAADDTAAIQSAIDVCAELGRRLHFSSKTYRTSVSLAVTTDRMTVTGDAGSWLWGEDLASGSQPILSVTGVRGTGVNLTSAALVGVLALAVDTTGFAKGDLIKLRSDRVYDDSSTDSPIGELLRVENYPSTTIAADSLPLASKVVESFGYATGQTARIEKITPVKGLRISGLGFRGKDALEDGVYGIQLTLCEDALVENCRSENCDLRFLRVDDCIYIKVKAPHVRMTRPTSQGYGVAFANATCDSGCEGGTFEEVRHAFSTNNSSADSGIPRRLYFNNNNVRMSARAAAGSGGDAVDTHSAAEDILIANNTVDGATGKGISVECGSVTLVGNIVTNCQGGGIHIKNQTDRRGRAIISNNQVRACSNDGILIEQGSLSSATFGELVVSGNVVQDCTGGQGIQLFAASASALSSAAVTGNVVSLIEGAGIHLTNCIATVVANNTVRQCGSQQIVLSDCNSIAVVGNALTAPTSGTAANIETLGTCGRLLVSGNSSRVMSGDIADYAIKFSANTTNSLAHANVGTGAFTSGQVNIGAGSGNVASDNLPT